MKPPWPSRWAAAPLALVPLAIACAPQPTSPPQPAASAPAVWTLPASTVVVGAAASSEEQAGDTAPSETAGPDVRALGATTEPAPADERTVAVDTGVGYPLHTLDASGHTPRAPSSGGGVSDAAAAQQSIRNGFPAIRRCYERALKQNPALTVGKPKTSLIVAKDGSVTRVDVSIPGEPALEACLEAVMSSWTFPPQPSGPVTVEYPIL